MSDFASSASTRSPKTAIIQEKCHLLRLPPELRNEIFHLALFDDGEADVDNTEEAKDEDEGQDGGKQRVDPNVTLIRAVLPAGAKLESAYRVDDADGAISIKKPFPFLVPIKDRDASGCMRWLKIVGTLPENVKRCSKSVVFRCSGTFFDKGGPDWPKRPKYAPDFLFWENVIASIRAAGLTAEQISWPFLDKKHTLSLSTALANAQSRKKTIQLQLLLSYVLPPLLREHGLASEHHPPKMISEALTVFTGFGPGGGLQSRALQAADGNPREWYQRWRERGLRARS